MKNVNTSKYMNTGEKIFELLNNFFEDIGEKNVIQVVTDNRSHKTKIILDKNFTLLIQIY